MLQVTLYVPENTNNGEPQPNVAESVAQAISTLAGGATVSDGLGYWFGSVLFRERVKLVSALVPDDADLGPYRELATYVKRTLAQESVLLTVTERISAEFL